MGKLLVFMKGNDIAKFKIEDDKGMFLWSPAKKEWIAHPENKNKEGITETIKEIETKIKKEFAQEGFRFMWRKEC